MNDNPLAPKLADSIAFIPEPSQLVPVGELMGRSLVSGTDVDAAIEGWRSDGGEWSDLLDAEEVVDG